MPYDPRQHESGTSEYEAARAAFRESARRVADEFRETVDVLAAHDRGEPVNPPAGTSAPP